MAIIYSYPNAATPTTNDVLLGTKMDNNKETKGFTIASLAALVSVTSGTGTVTSVATADSTFISITGGAITSSGTLTASLSATGSPSDSTFLRGDNTWAPASSTGSPNIAVLDEGSSVTSAVTSLNFTGGGVTATVGSSNDVTVNIPSVTGAVTSLIAGNGISVDQATGNVTVANTGVLSLIAGSNITLSPATGLGSVTINAENNPGTVQSVLPGDGLVLGSGTNTSNPNIGVSYTGSNNYILVGSSAAAPTQDDFIPFNQLSSSDVKTTRLLDIPETALPLVKQYVDTGDSNTVKNNTDTYTTTAVVNNVVTLTQAEYAALSPKDVNTFYVVIANASAGTAFTVTLNTTNSITGGTAGVEYVLSGDVNGATQTGISGEPYSFTTIATPAAGFYFSTPAGGLTETGTIASTTNVNQTLTGVIAAVPTPTVTATLLVVTNIQGGPSDGSGFTIGGSLTGATQAGTSPLTVNAFATTCTPSAGYTFSVGPTIVNASGTINGTQTVVTTITGTLQLT